MPEFLDLCFSGSVVRRAIITASIVGTILILINHSDALLRGEMDQKRLLQIVLTMMVPYLVSTVSSVTTILDLKKDKSLSWGSKNG